MILYRQRRYARSIARGGNFMSPGKPTVRSYVMKWETPQAIDFRFGMEITMYIANR
jgi:coenzyme PQQ precursor peptide PqqA